MPTKKKKAVKKVTLPKITSTFALIDIKKNGRFKLANLVAQGYKIPFTISGYLMPGASSVGHDDGVSIEFAADVLVADFGEPKLEA